MITLDNGQRVVLQRYRRRDDAEYRLRVMRALQAPAAQVGIPLPRVRDFNLDGNPAWVIYDVLPGVPMPVAGEAGPGGPQFPQMARIMRELLAAFRRLPAAGQGPAVDKRPLAIPRGSPCPASTFWPASLCGDSGSASNRARRPAGP